MNGMEQPAPQRKESPIVALYHEKIPREPQVIMSEAAELEQRFIYAESAHDIAEEERLEMVKSATSLIPELADVIATSTHDETTSMARSLKTSLEGYAGPSPEETIH